MMFRIRPAGLLGLIPVLGLAAAGLAWTGQAAAAARAAQTCPTVSSTGTVSPPPAPGVNWSGCDLTNANLGNADLKNAKLDGATLTGATLTGANLSGTSMFGAVLTNVISGKITGTPLDLPTNWMLASGYLAGPGADLAAASLAHADLASADLTGTNLTGANLTSTNLSSANLTSGTLTGADAPGADLQDAELQTADLSNATLTSAQLQSARLPGAVVTGANLTGANLTGAMAYIGPYEIPETDLTNVNLSDANLTNMILSNTNLSGTQLAGAIATGVESGSITGTPASLPSASWTLVDGYLIGPEADLYRALLPDQNLTGADLSDAYLMGITLNGANLTDADLNGANISNGYLIGATVTGATFIGVKWFDTYCPDGSNSNKHDHGCFTPLDTDPPLAHPHVISGRPGVNGWYVSPVTVGWDWTDDGTLNYPTCSPPTKTSKTAVLTASCMDLAGNTGFATFAVKVDTSLAVTVTGVTSGSQYIYGRAPAPRCKTTDTVSGVARRATLLVTGGSHGVGSFTATCTDGRSVAGGKASATAKYTVVYGFGGFRAPRAGSTIRKTSHQFAVLFRLTDAGGRSISGTTARRLAARRKVLVTLTGPGIKAVHARCTWNAARRDFQCTVRIPAGVRTGHASGYSLSVTDNLGFGFRLAPGVSTAKNPETIHFR